MHRNDFLIYRSVKGFEWDWMARGNWVFCINLETTRFNCYVL